MGERGFALLEALLVLAIVAVTGTVAMRVIAELPPRAREWEESAAERQTLRVIESRIARVAVALPITVDVDGVAVRVPAVWPRRLGLVRPEAAGVVSSGAITVLSRVDPHRMVVLSSALAAGGGSVAFASTRGCGSEAACGFGAGDMVLAIDRTSAAGLFRVASAGARLDVEGVMAGAGSFPPASVLVPVSVDVISFDAGERALRRYDGYRSDNVLVDGVAQATWSIASDRPLNDGPFVGAGAMAFDADQLFVRSVALTVRLVDRPSQLPPAEARLTWRILQWP